MKPSAKVTGFRHLELNVKSLQDKITRGGMRTALTKAARLTTAAVKSKAPTGRTGLLKRSIRQKMITNTRKQSVTAIIGPSTKIKGTDPKTGKPVRPANYAHLVEFGTAARGSYGRKGESVMPGNPPQPFVRPGMEETRSAVLSKYKAEIGPAITATAARIAKRKSRPR